MSATAIGIRRWTGSRDNEGHREYKVIWRIKTSSVADGPAAVLAAAGVPVVGTAWSEDPWAFCMPELKATPRLDNEKNVEWELEQTYSTKPLKRCQTTSIEDPLDEPPDISGSFVKHYREATVDRFGNPIRSSSYEVLRGKAVEREENKPTVVIKMNFATNQLATYAPLIDFVNDSTLWGLPARCVKLSNAPWKRQLYGSCSYYYTVTYEFDINYATFDRRLVDKGTRVLRRGGNPTNPTHFSAYHDGKGETGEIPLDGAGRAWTGPPAPPGYIYVEFYEEANLLSLGIPSSL